MPFLNRMWLRHVALLILLAITRAQAQVSSPAFPSLGPVNSDLITGPHTKQQPHSPPPRDVETPPPPIIALDPLPVSEIEDRLRSASSRQTNITAVVRPV